MKYGCSLSRTKRGNPIASWDRGLVENWKRSERHSILFVALTASSRVGTPRYARGFGRSAPRERKRFHASDILHDKIGLFHLALRLLHDKFSAMHTDRVHAEFVAGADLAHGPVADHEHLVRRKFNQLL